MLRETAVHPSKMTLTALRQTSILVRSYIPVFNILTRTIMSKSIQIPVNDSSDLCKKNAAYKAVDENINSDGIIGVGSGSTVAYVIERLATRCAEKNLNVKCIPTSNKTRELIEKFGLKLTSLDENPVIDVAIDGADEVDNDFVTIKGGGACATQEKIVASVSKRFIIVADHRKNSLNLGDNWKRGIPIDVIPNAVTVVRHRISQTFNVPIDKIPIRLDSKTNKPVITDDGNYVIDWIFGTNDKENVQISDWRNIAKTVKLMTGVVDIGLFIDVVKVAYFGNIDHSVTKREAK